jgi:hypothetical protein
VLDADELSRRERAGVLVDRVMSARRALLAGRSGRSASARADAEDQLRCHKRDVELRAVADAFELHPVSLR